MSAAGRRHAGEDDGDPFAIPAGYALPAAPREGILLCRGAMLCAQGRSRGFARLSKL